ncbi:MAG: M15 family metallopeptidase [Succinivibrionaceae bacterium]|nr:M15 family metallopeptidase [Succinivibrionaceae bacterium]
MTYTIEQLTGQDQSHLVPLEGFEKHLLTPETARAFSAMREDAARDGIDIAPVSCFRSFQRQLEIWNDKYLGDRPVYDNRNRPVNVGTLTGVETVYAILYWSALPGFSRHHWGTDLDVASQKLMPEGYQLQLTSDEYGPDGIFAPLTAWLDRHMEEYGFFRPFTDDAHVRVGTELWHLSHRSQAAEFERLISREVIAKVVGESQIAGKSCLKGMIDELYDDYIIHL